MNGGLCMAKFNIDAVEAKTMHGLKDFQRATAKKLFLRLQRYWLMRR